MNACLAQSPGLLSRAAIVLLLVAAPADSQPASPATNEPPRLRILPVLGSAPETGLQYGVTALRVYRLGADATTRTSQQQAYLIHTANGQLRGFVQLDRWSPGNRWRVRLRGEGQHFPLPYYGVGDAAPDSSEEWYTASGPSLSALVQRRVAGAWFLSASGRLLDTRISDREPDGELSGNQVHGASGGRIVQAQIGVSRDSRDHVLAPRIGGLAQITVASGGRAIGSEFSYTRHALDLRRYWSARGGVLAVQLLGEATLGRAPFDQLVQVGADTAMRGYVRGRFRDRHGVNAQAEYRSPYARRVGFVAFAGGGVVAPTLADLSTARFLPTAGVGARYLLVPSQRASVRVDLGFGRGGSGLYVALNEAF